MLRKKGEDRRRVNLPVEEERRVLGMDRRRCPACGAGLRREVRAVPGGTETWTTCDACHWKDCTVQANSDGTAPARGAAQALAEGVKRDWQADRRKRNLPVAQDRRSGRHDRRVCPDCHSPLQQFVRKAAHGSLTRTYCVRCGWSVESRQQDQDGAGPSLARPSALPLVPSAPATPPALLKPVDALRSMAQRRLDAARVRAARNGTPVEREDRRRVNVAVPVERRHGGEKRKCPHCGSSLQQSVKELPGGALTRTFCTKCSFEAQSRQVDEARMHALLGFQAAVMGTPERPWLELTPEFLNVARLLPGDTVFLEPIYTPGSAEAIKWVVKTPRSL